MKITREEKRKNISEICKQIDNCESEDDLERVGDILNELLQAGLIFKKDYKFLEEELDNRLMTLIEKELI